MMPEMDYQAIRQRVEEGIRKEKLLAKFVLFCLNFALFIVFMVLAWQTHVVAGGALPRWEDFINLPGIPRANVDPNTSALMMASAGWGIALLFHVVSMILDTRLGERQIRERVMGREINKEMERLGVNSLEAYEKRKTMMRLTDDGELEALDGLDDVRPETVARQRSD